MCKPDWVPCCSEQQVLGIVTFKEDTEAKVGTFLDVHCHRCTKT
jgi:hypothetical protein